MKNPSRQNQQTFCPNIWLLIPAIAPKPNATPGNWDRHLGIGIALLDAFSRGEVKLGPDYLKALARDLFHGHAIYDPLEDVLRPAVKQEPQPLGSAPTWEHPGYPPRVVPGPRAGSSGLQLPPAPKPKKRAGWAE
jgi:hypothetical protein